MDKTTLRRKQELNDYYYQQMFDRMFPERVVRQHKQERLGYLYTQLAELEAGLVTLEEGLGYKYDPNQPRVPAGNPDGGQWTSGGVSADDGEGEIYDPPIEPVYLVETLLSGLTVKQAANAIRSVVSLWQGTRTIGRQFEDIADGIEEYLGGPPKRIFKNPKGDLIIMRDGKKIRFNAEDPHGYDPHFHIEEQLPSGDWVDATEQHMYFFRKD